MTTHQTDPIRLVRSFLHDETIRLVDHVRAGSRDPVRQITLDTEPMLSNYLGGIRAALSALELDALTADVDQLANAGQPLTADQYLDLERRIRRLEQLRLTSSPDCEHPTMTGQPDTASAGMMRWGCSTCSFVLEHPRIEPVR